ncbi:endothelin-converting enzyme 1-like protein [Leptotrombidium deliense]|uniref:Endothelin-converting enzyme 1-like protein n=1 Tax=Leptotrombidium deliense TaxID=299467 RepID=A0A443SA70_9ACAR|nr:endothelin-converting enzyme 1-like protein [Leptotrombidium deliense]
MKAESTEMTELPTDGNVDQNDNLNQSIRKNVKSNQQKRIKRLKNENRGLITTVVVLSITIIILIIVLIAKRNGYFSSDLYTCTTNACKETATLEDFHTFHHSAVRKAQNFFAACNNLDYRDEYGIEDMKIAFIRIGGFPLINKKWKEKDYDWKKAYTYVDTRFDSVQPFFEYDFGETMARTTVLKLHSPYKFEIGVKTLFTGTAEDRKSNATYFREFIKRKINAIGTDVDEEQIDKDITDLIAFDEKLTKLAVQGIQINNEYIRFTFGELQGNITAIPWLKMFNEIFSLVDEKIDENEPIFVQNAHHYFKQLGNILDETPKRTLANYVAWKVVNEFGSKALLNLQQIDKGK